jgi:hypothetical protein
MNLPDTFLVKQVAQAWPAGKRNPWRLRVTRLLAKYNLRNTDPLTISAATFAQTVKEAVATHLASQWRTSTKETTRLYMQTYRTHPDDKAGRAAAPYIHKLTSLQRGKGATIWMQLRFGSLPLNAGKISKHIRQAKRVAHTVDHTDTLSDEPVHITPAKCPCCLKKDETEVHFLFDCPHYVVPRSALLDSLAAEAPEIIKELRDGKDDKHRTYLKFMDPEAWTLQQSHTDAPTQPAPPEATTPTTQAAPPSDQRLRPRRQQLQPPAAPTPSRRHITMEPQDLNTAALRTISRYLECIWRMRGSVLAAEDIEPGIRAATGREANGSGGSYV